MKKIIKNCIGTVAIAIACMSMTACGSDDEVTEKSFTTDPVESSKLYACGIPQTETRGVDDATNVVFTDDDILWFDVNTREIRSATRWSRCVKQYHCLPGSTST